MKHTILASAVLLAFGTANAADIPTWVDPTGDAKEINTIELSQNSWEGGYFAVAENGGSNSAGITSLTKDSPFTLDRDTWLVNNTGNNVYGALISGSGEVKNTANIYVQGNKDTFWKTKAILLGNGSTFTNEGLIYAKNAYGVMVLSGSTVNYTNKNKIVVEGVGVAMDFAGKGDTTVSGSMTNAGDIFLIANEDTANSTDDNPLVAIRLAENNASDNALSFTNSGNIYADGLTAILVEDGTRGSVNLSGASHVEGLVDLNDKSDLKITELESAQTIQLADKVNKISVDASTVTFEQGTDKALNINELSTANGSDVDIKLHRVGSAEEKVLTIREVTEGSSVDVGYTGNVSDDLLGGKVSQGNLFDGVSIAEDQHQPDSVTVDQGLMGDEMVLTKDANGNIVSRVTRTNDLLRSAQDLAITNALMSRRTHGIFCRPLSQN